MIKWMSNTPGGPGDIDSSIDTMGAIPISTDKKQLLLRNSVGGDPGTPKFKKDSYRFTKQSEEQQSMSRQHRKSKSSEPATAVERQSKRQSYNN